MVYVVQRNDTPASIAARFGQSNALPLIAANPQKARQVVHGVTTFRALGIGEQLNVPNTWLGRSNGSGTMSGFGLGDVSTSAPAVVALSAADLCNGNGQAAITQFQTDYNATAAGTATPIAVSGVYDTPTQAALQAVLIGQGGGTAPAACAATPTTSTSLTDLQNAANAVIADSSICNGSANANVQNFQTLYNSYTSSTLTEDGKYGTASAAAMVSTSQISGVTLSGSPPAACSIYTGGGTTPAPSGGGSTTTTTTTTSSTTVSSTQSATPWIVAGVAAVAGAGVFYFLKKHPTAKGKVHKKTAHHPMHRLAHHHR